MVMTNRETIEILEEVKMLDDSIYAYNPAYSEAIDLAIEALKAQEPRLLTADDFKDNSDVDICGYLPCWVEPNPHGDAATEKPGWGLVSVGQIGGVYHRHWTGKTTQEQMEVTPWQ